MSKNRADISFLYNEEPDLDKAWEDMRQKLDEKIPVKKSSRPKKLFKHRFLYRSLPVFFILMVLLLLTNNYYIPGKEKTDNYANNKITPAESTGKNKELITGNKTFVYGKKDSVKNVSRENVTPSFAGVNRKTENPHNPFASLTKRKNALYNESTQDHFETKPMNAAGRGGEINSLTLVNGTSRETIVPLIKKNVFVADTLFMNRSPGKKEKNKNNRVIGFDIGAYYNIGSSIREIYPIADINVLVAKKSYLSLGIGLRSNVPIRNFSPREFIILNDTASLVKFGVTSNEIKKATYIDLPISFNYRINESWVVNAGTQVSFLQNFNKEPEYKAYGFQTDISKVIPSNFVAGTNGGGLDPLHTYSEHYTVRKTNWRFIAGISYQLKNAGLKFQYQRSFTSNYNLFDFGGINSKKKLSIFTMGIYYQLR